MTNGTANAFGTPEIGSHNPFARPPQVTPPSQQRPTPTSQPAATAVPQGPLAAFSMKVLYGLARFISALLNGLLEVFLKLANKVVEIEWKWLLLFLASFFWVWVSYQNHGIVWTFGEVTAANLRRFAPDCRCAGDPPPVRTVAGVAGDVEP